MGDTGKNPVTMRDVAKAAGVSRMTVSRALKKDSPISKETREHILAVVKKMNYVPDQMAGSLTTKKSGFVAALLPSLNNLHFAQTIQGLTEEIEKTGLQILLGHTNYSAEREEDVVETMLRRRPEAIVLSYDGHKERTSVLLKEAGIPVIEIWEKPENPLGYSVGFSNSDAAKEMTNELIKRGFKRPVFLSEKDDDWTRGAARRRGFEQAMTENGLDEGRVFRFGVPPLSIEDGAKSAEALMAQFPDVDCVFCVSDMAAFGFLGGLRDMGLTAPDDVAVVGFGNFEVSRFSKPSISTVTVDAIGIGRTAGRLINQLLDTKNPISEDEMQLDFQVLPQLTFRESTDI